jgi:dihydrodipicolinate synthase/N-acetylneuraminate lyase
MTRQIGGVLPVILMPYDDRGTIDEGDFRRQVDYIVDSGCEGFVIGQMSEVLRMTPAERFRVAELCADAADGRCLSVMSTGSESTRAAIEFSRQAQRAGVDALLVLHPTIMALDEEEMYSYFAEIIEAVDLPVIVHHAKSLAKRPLSIWTQTRLLTTYGPERVLFKPEAAPTPPRVSQLRAATQRRARIFEGDGGMMLVDCYQRGVAGTIPAADCTEIVAALWRLLKAGDLARARRLGYPLAYLMCHMMNSIDCYLGIAKHLLKRRGLIRTTHVRKPIDFVVDPETLSEVEFVYDGLLQTAKEMI